MYNEIWKSVEGLFKPLHPMSNMISIPELTFDLMGMLRLNIKDSQFSDSSKYKRIVKQDMLNPTYQLMNIIFDFDDENQKHFSLKLFYEGKITLLTIIPYQYIEKQYTLEGPIPQLMLEYLITTRGIINNDLRYLFNSPTEKSTMAGVVSIHSIPLLFTKWMNSVFGIDSSVTEKIIDIMKSMNFPAYFTNEHIAIYTELLRNSSIEKLLDYSIIATEEKILSEAFFQYSRDMIYKKEDAVDDDSEEQSCEIDDNNRSENESKDTKNISEGENNAENISAD